jgi:membrane protein implicated in regulation of membrane protease activity
MLVPHIDMLGKPFMLEKVQLIRLLLGLGLLNLFQLVLIIRRLPTFSGRFMGKWYIAGYAAAVFIVQLLLGILAMNRAPGFIVLYQVIILALPVPVIIYLLLRKRITLAIIGFAAFSVLTTCLVNPLYRGTEVLTQTPLTKAIQATDKQQPGIWVADTIYLENFATLSGARTISGVYTYPQLDLWRSLDDGTKEDIYNRYAHISFNLDRKPTIEIPTTLELPIPDHFDINTEPCGAYIKEKKVRYILTAQKINEPCVELEKTVSYTALNVFIYKIR